MTTTISNKPNYEFTRPKRRKGGFLHTINPKNPNKTLCGRVIKKNWHEAPRTSIIGDHCLACEKIRRSNA